MDGGVNGSRVGQEDSRLLPRSPVRKGELICIHAIIRPDLVDGKVIYKWFEDGRPYQGLTPSKLDILEISV
jgi:hypothetical protein